MANTGWLLAGSVQTGNGTTGGGHNWSNAANAQAKDGSFATVAIGGTFVAYDFRAYNFGIDIPAHAVITGIEARVKWATASGTLFQDAQLSLCDTDGSTVDVGGGDYADKDTNDATPKTISISGTQAEYTVGGSADDWGGRYDIAATTDRAWLPSDFDSNFGIVLAGVASADNANINLDSIEIRIHYVPIKVNVDDTDNSTFGNITLTFADVTEGDVWVVGIMYAGTANDISPPDGTWTEHLNDATTPNNGKLGIFSKTVSGGESTNQTFTCASASRSGVAFRLEGAGDLNAVAASFVGDLQTATHVGDDITTTEDDCVLLAFLANSYGTNTWTPVDMVEACDFNRFDAGLAAAYANPVAADTYNPSWTKSGQQRPWIYSIAFAPASDAEPVSGSGDIAAQQAATDGAGAVIASSSGALDAPQAAASGTAAAIVGASGALDAQQASTSGTAVAVVSASGQITAEDASIEGAGAVVVSASSALAAEGATVAGAGTVAVAGSGAVAAPQASVDGAGSVIVSASGALDAEPAAIAGTSGQVVTASGALDAQGASLTGTGAAIVGANGALEAPQASASGTAVAIVSAASALQAETASVSAAGTVAITSIGALSAQAATVATDADVIVAGSGAMEAQQATADGNARIIVSAAADLQAEAPSLSASSQFGRQASGALVANAASISGAGVVVVSAAGSLDAPQATTDGDLAAIVGGSGAVEAQQAATAGTAELVVSASGTLEASQASASGVLGALVSGSGAMAAVPASTAGAVAVRIVASGTLTAQQALISGVATDANIIAPVAIEGIFDPVFPLTGVFDLVEQIEAVFDPVAPLTGVFDLLPEVVSIEGVFDPVVKFDAFID